MKDRKGETMVVDGDLTEVARMLRAAIEALPPETAIERAIASQAAGAATALDLVVGRTPRDSDG